MVYNYKEFPVLMLPRWNYGTEGRGFESLQPHQILHPALTDWHRTQMLKPLTVFVLNK